MILTQVQCPYCKVIDDIDYEPYGEPRDGDIMTISCPICEKNFCATLNISFSVSMESVEPCQNGGEHEWEEIRSFPDFYSVHRRCRYCEEVDCQRDPEKVKAYVEYCDRQTEKYFESRKGNGDLIVGTNCWGKFKHWLSPDNFENNKQPIMQPPLEITQVTNSDGSVNSTIETGDIFTWK